MNGMDVVRICRTELELSLEDMENEKSEAQLRILYEQAKDQLDSMYHALKTKLEG